MKQLLCLTLLTSMLFTACTKTEPDVQKPQLTELSTSKSSLTLSGKAAGVDSITVQSSSKWTLAISGNSGEWLKTNVSSGAAGATKVYVTVLQSNTQGTARTATIHITPEGDASKPLSFVVTQQPYAAEPWGKLFGGSKGDVFDAMFATPDRGYIMVGGAESSDGDLVQNKGGYDGWIVKVAQDGSIQWQRSYGGSAYDRFFSVISNGKGGYLLAGVSYSSDGDLTQPHRGNGDVWIMEIDANGNKRWQKTYGGSGNEYASSLVPTRDGGYIVQASSWSEDGDVTKRVAANHNDYDWWIFKIDAAGNKVWDRNFGGFDLDIAASVIAVNGGYLVTGATRSTDGDAVGNHGDADGLIIKIDESGNKLWSKLLGGTASDGLVAAVAVLGGGFVFTGNSSSNDGDVHENEGGADAWIVKTDDSGNILWERTYGGAGYDNFRCITPTSNGGYLVADETSSSSGDVMANQGKNDGWVLALDASGNKVWQKTYGGAGYENFNFLQRGADGYYIMVGVTGSSNGDGAGGHGGEDAWAIKFNMP